MKLTSTLAIALFAATCIAATIPSNAQTMPTDVRTRIGTRANSDTNVNRAGVRGPMTFPSMMTPHTVPESGQTLNVFNGPATVTRVTSNAMTIRMQAGTTATFAVAARSMNALHIRSGSRLMLTTLRNGRIKVQTLLAPCVSPAGARDTRCVRPTQ
jgi:hypothetical protein